MDAPACSLNQQEHKKKEEKWEQTQTREKSDKIIQTL